MYIEKHIFIFEHLFIVDDKKREIFRISHIKINFQKINDYSSQFFRRFSIFLIEKTMKQQKKR